MPRSYDNCCKTLQQRGLAADKACKACSIAFWQKAGMTPAAADRSARDVMEDLTPLALSVVATFSATNQQEDTSMGNIHNAAAATAQQDAILARLEEERLADRLIALSRQQTGQFKQEPAHQPGQAPPSSPASSQGLTLQTDDEQDAERLIRLSRSQPQQTGGISLTTASRD